MADERNADQKLIEAIRSFPNSVKGIVLAAILGWVLIAVYAFAAAGLDPPDRFQIIYQTGLVIAGIIGLPLAIWRSFTAHRQAEAALRQITYLARQVSLAETGAEADRFLKGAELIQGDTLAARGGRHRDSQRNGDARRSYISTGGERPYSKVYIGPKRRRPCIIRQGAGVR